MPSLSFPETGVFLGPRRGTPQMLSENGPLNPHMGCWDGRIRVPGSMGQHFAKNKRVPGQL